MVNIFVIWYQLGFQSNFSLSAVFFYPIDMHVGAAPPTTFCHHQCQIHHINDIGQRLQSLSLMISIVQGSSIHS